MRIIALFAVSITLGACAGASKQVAVRPSQAGPNTPGTMGASATGTTRVATTSNTPPARAELKEQLVVEGWISMASENVPKTVDAIRKQIGALSGRVVSEQVSGGKTSWNAHLRVRVPPSGMNGFVSWLNSHGSITSKRIKGTDVSRKLFDQAIALANLTQTMNRLRKLLESPGLKMKEILSIEKELTRLRGRIESIKGEQRFLKDRVRHATLDINLTRKEGEILDPQVKFYPGGRFTTLTLFDRSEGQKRTRFGGGVAIYTFPEPKNKSAPRVSIDLDTFQDADGRGRGFMASVGSAIYSDFLGSGKRKFLNPYLQMRLGYGYINESSFVAGAGAGVELFKHKRVVIDVNVNSIGFIRDSVKLGVVTGVGAVLAF